MTPDTVADLCDAMAALVEAVEAWMASDGNSERHIQAMKKAAREARWALEAVEEAEE